MVSSITSSGAPTHGHSIHPKVRLLLLLLLRPLLGERARVLHKDAGLLWRLRRLWRHRLLEVPRVVRKLGVGRRRSEWEWRRLLYQRLRIAGKLRRVKGVRWRRLERWLLVWLLPVTWSRLLPWDLGGWLLLLPLLRLGHDDGRWRSPSRRRRSVDESRW
jgi:hypothetical protein